MADVGVAARQVCPLSTRQIIDRLCTFCQEAGGTQWYLYQTVFARGVMESVLRVDGKTLTGLFARQSGKTEVLANLGTGLPLILPALAHQFPDDERFASFVKGYRIGIFAPSSKHSGIVYMRIRARAQSEAFSEYMYDPAVNVDFQHSRYDSFSYTNGSVVEANTASETVLNEGGTYHLMLVDESQKISAKKFNKELRPMLTHHRGTMVMIGTALSGGSAFHKQVKTNAKAEGRRTHFEFDYLRVIRDRRSTYNRTGEKEHLNYEASINDELARLGGNIEDDSFKMNYRLLWHTSGESAINMEVFRDLKRSDIELNTPWMKPGRIIAGMDVGKTNDKTWIVVGHVDTTVPIIQHAEFGDGKSHVITYRVTVIGLCSLAGSFEGEYGQYENAVRFLSMWPQLETFTVDATGVGDPVYERFTVLLPNVNVQPFKFSPQAKSNAYKRYLQRIGSRQISYAGGVRFTDGTIIDDYESEHEGLHKSYNGSILQVYAGDPEGHDDGPDATVTMLEGVDVETIPVVNPTASFASGGYKGVPHVRVFNTPAIHLGSSPRTRR